MKADVVARNEAVTIVYEVPGILLTVRGKALEAGAVGDLINVLNIQSNRTVQAAVIGPGQVVIAATTPRLAAAVAPLRTTGAVAPSERHHHASRVLSTVVSIIAQRRAARRLHGVRPARHARRTAGADRDREPDLAAGLQAGAHADADAAAGLLQPELAVAERLARLLQGSARAPGRRHPHRQGQDHRQGHRSRTKPAAAARTTRTPASTISSARRKLCRS